MKVNPGLPLLFSAFFFDIMNEQTPLLQQKQNCCSSNNKTAIEPPTCCSLKKKKVVCKDLPPVNDQDYCFLADQKWEYKSIAFMCAIFLAGKMNS